MRVISRKRLREFWERHPDAQAPLELWFRLVEHQEPGNFAELKRTFGSVDRAGKYTVFDVGGNKYRVIAHVHYDRQCLYVRWVLTHREYDQWKP
ncbi:type II toxin-antitoxin system HigB family toxin [Acidithiobacillus sp. MC6.1]|nr:type II toxin-antitoxin system HigB family toxin [Acidithiobacillus sp. MC6.1]